MTTRRVSASGTAIQISRIPTDGAIISRANVRVFCVAFHVLPLGGPDRSPNGAGGANVQCQTCIDGIERDG